MPLFLTLSVLAHHPAASQADGFGAFLFFYRPHEGQRQAFDEGYRRHLDWHRQAGDTLVWYAWDILTGDRIDQFVDGVFGATMEAVDHRVDPPGDGRDFSETTEPYARALSRTLYQLRPDLSSDLFLEERRPSPLMQVYLVDLIPGRADQFRSALSAARQRARFAVYDAVDGGPLPRVLVLAPREGLRQLAPLDALLGQSRGEPAWGAVRSVQSETWRYRADLTYLP